MARKDLLKKAFRNNFLRKSVADLKSLGAEKAPRKHRHASSTSLRSTYEEAAPVLPRPLLSIDEFLTQENASSQQQDHADTNGANLLAASEAAKTSRESVTEWLETIPKDAVQMSSSEIRHEMEKVRTMSLPLPSYQNFPYEYLTGRQSAQG